MKTLFTAAIILVACACYCQQKETYPTTKQTLETKIIALDAAAFEAYNICDLEKFKTFFTDDLEFYHDKGSVTLTSAKLMETMKTGICGKANWKLRREVIPGTLKVYPMDGYGALLTGDHSFYVTENGKEQLTGKAKFTHLWLLKDGQWKMSRVFSYDHAGAK